MNLTTGLLALALIVALAHFVAAGVLTGTGMPINISENHQPLFRLLVDNTPIASLGRRQYGVVAFLLIDPVVRVAGRDELVLSEWALALGLVGVLLAFVLCARRYGIRTTNGVLALAILWLGFAPLVAATATRLFDLPVLGMLATALYLYTGGRRARGWTGVALGVGFLTKLLPIVLLPLLWVRERWAVGYGVAAIVALLLLGQVLYGPLIGLGYPIFLATSTSDTAYGFSFQNENDSIRGLLFKAASRFRLVPGANVATPAFPGVLNAMVYVIDFALVGYVLYVLFRHRATEGLPRRSVEFALGIVTMYLVAPHAAHEHLVSMILVYTIALWTWIHYPALRTAAIGAALGLSILLVGVYLPASLVAFALGVEPLMRLAGNASSEVFGSPIGMYDALGFPGYGLILALIALVLLERRTRSATDSV